MFTVSGEGVLFTVCTVVCGPVTSFNTLYNLAAFMYPHLKKFGVLKTFYNSLSLGCACVSGIRANSFILTNIYFKRLG